jgi:O-antigen/teichoic acid export membrane protein
MVVLNLLFVVALRWGVAGIFYSEIIVFGVMGLAFTARALGEVGVRLDRALARQMIRFGTPLMLMPFAALFLTRLDIMFLTHYGSLAHVGVYVLGLQCAQVLWLAVIYPFRHVWDPMQFQLGTDLAGRRLFRRMFQWVTFLAIVAAFGCAVAAEDVIRVMTAPAFHGAAVVVPILVIAYVLEAVHLFFNAALLRRNRTPLVAAVALVTVAVNLGANALLVPAFLDIGAAASRVLAMTAMAVTTFVLGRRLWPHRPDFLALAKVAACATALFALSASLPDLPLVASAAVNGGLVIALVALAVVVGAVDRDDVRSAWNLVARTGWGRRWMLRFGS